MADTEATIDVLRGQLAMYEDLPDTVEGLSRITRGPGAVDIGGKLILSNGEICFAFGKHKGEPVWAVPTHYIEWVMANIDLGTDAAKILRGVMAERINTNQ